MNNNFFAIITLVFASISGYSVAAGPANSDPCAGVDANSFAGRVLCGTGNSSVASCAGCHGEDGNSMVPTFPKLAGQNAKYLADQLMAFKTGARADAGMQGIAESMNEANNIELAEFYARLNTSENSLPELDEDDEEDLTAPLAELVKLGEDLYIHGNKTNQIAACAACHGANGDGNTPAGYPALASQHAAYLIKTLNDFKSGSRTKDVDNVMYMISKKMSDQDIEAVAYYLSILK